MRQDITSGTRTRHAAAYGASTAAGLRLLLAALLGGILIALVYQIPAIHRVDIGGYDAAYVQGFYDPSRADAPAAPAYLEGSDGRARWTRNASFLLFPQIGLPAELTLRVRAAPDAPANQRIAVVLNNVTSLGELTPTAEWREYRYSIESGLTKPSDVVVELRAAQTTPVSAQDSREVGLLVDGATLRTTAWPIMPYPWQLALGALAGVLAWALFERTSERANERKTNNSSGFRLSSFVFRLPFVALIGIAFLFLLLYRLQPVYPHPLRFLLPGINLLLAALVLLRYAPAAVRRIPALPNIVAGGTLAVWLGAITLSARQHLVLSVPGVEKDFRVFAERSAHLFGTFQSSGVYDSTSDGVFRADGFYNLGYPFLLWLARPFVFDNAFLAAQIVAIASGAVLLLMTWWLAHRLFGAGGGLLAILCLVFSPLIAQYGVYLGTDMPFAAACTVALALLVCGDRRPTTDDRRPPDSVVGRRSSHQLVLALAGIAAGIAFLFRHPGLVLLPFGWLAIVAMAWRRRNIQHVRMPLLIFTLGFLVAALPQVAVNMRDTGNPLFSYQAKNIWLAVYGNSDWANWYGAPNSISLSDVMLSDPARFFGNWTTNIRGFLGAGGEDVSEFGRADQLRLLAFPVNWLAIVALGTWAFRGSMALRLLLVWAAVYTLGVAVGLSILRFALPLVPIYALAAAWSALWLGRTLARWLDRRPQLGPILAQRTPLFVGMVLLALIFGGLGVGSNFVLQNQPADERAAVQLVQRTVAPNERVRMELDPRIQFDEYSAVAHLVAQPDQSAAFVLRSINQASQPSEIPIESAGGYTLYRIQP